MVVGAAILLLAALLVRRSFVMAPALEGTIVDAKGNPLSGCFVVYDYQFGGGFEPRPGSIIETDSKGYFRIPRKLFRIPPIWNIHPQIWVWRIYSTKTHTATAMWPLGGFVEGVVDARPQEKKMIFYDVSDSPADWFAALTDLQETLARMPSQYRLGDIGLENCGGEKLKLFQACSNEVALFRNRYYSTPYQRPKYLKAENDYRAAYGRTFGAWSDQWQFR